MGLIINLSRTAKPNGTPVYSAVQLPVQLAGHGSGMFQFPTVGTLTEVGFNGGRPDMPFVSQTVPLLKPGEQLQQ
ncbi:hypothetical protein [Pantoea rwandensis]|nr:hypothetical protein [Pantoea rwandensis]